MLHVKASIAVYILTVMSISLELIVSAHKTVDQFICQSVEVMVKCMTIGVNWKRAPVQLVN